MIYHKGETISKYVYFKDEDKVAMDPDSESTKIYKPNGELQETVVLHWVETGKYEFNWNIPDSATEGKWKVIILAQRGTWKRKKVFYFDVREA